MSPSAMARLLVTHWHVSASLTGEVALVAGVYLWAVARRVRRWPLGRTLAYLAGLGVILVALQSGIDAYDDRLLSVHMVQHMLLLLLAPLLLLLGRPQVLALRALPAGSRPALVRALDRLRPLTHPLGALLIFMVVLVGTHLPAFYDATLRHPALHDAEHALYVASGLLLLAPLLDGDPVPAHQLGGLGRLVYMLAAMPAMAVVGAYLNRHTPLVYGPYAGPSRALGIDPLVDQDQAGAIMWVAGDLFITAVGLCSALGAMVRAERRQQARETYAARAAWPGADAGAGV